MSILIRTKPLFILLLLFSAKIFSQSDTDSIHFFKSQLEKEANDSLQIQLQIKIADRYLGVNKDSAYTFYRAALNESTQIGSEHYSAESHYGLGRYYERNHDYKRAIESFIAASLHFVALKDESSLAASYNSIGYNYLHLYAEDKAIEYYLKSLKIYQKLDDKTGIAMNYVDIGNLYYDAENYDYAINYFEDALNLYEQLQDQEGIASSYTNLGNAKADSGDIEEGLNFYERSIEIQSKMDDQYGIAINQNNIGDCHIQLENYSKAVAYFEKSLRIAEQIEDEELEAIIYLNLSDVFIKTANYPEAIKYADKSLVLSKKFGIIDFEVDNLMFLATAHENLGNETRSLEYLKAYKNLKDSIDITESAKRVQLFNALNNLEKSQFTIDELSVKNELAQIKYENEKKITYLLIIAIVVFAFLIVLLISQQASKKKAYDLLTYKNAQIHKMNDEIQEQRDHLDQLNRTKDTFFSIIAHDLKNPFNSIKGFSELMIENIKNYNEEKRLKFLKIIKESSIKASGLLNNLLIWANSQSGNLSFEPKKIQLNQNISDVISLLSIQAMNKDIRIIDKTKPTVFVYADNNMLNTILRNIVSNAIKFTKSGGFVKISSQNKNKQVIISVEDNGIGIDPAEVKQLFSIDKKSSTVGTNNEQGSGFGLILCKDFVEKHGGTINIESKLEKGTTVRVSIPAYHT